VYPGDPQITTKALIEYFGTFSFSLVSHGNVKYTIDRPYVCSHLEVIAAIKKQNGKGPTAIFNELWEDGSFLGPRDIRQIKNTRAHIKRKLGKASANLADNVETMLNFVGQHPFVQRSRLYMILV